MIKRYIKLLEELADIKLFLLRYLVNFILLIEIILLPLLLSPDDYIQIELFKNILLFTPIALFGINSGYIKIYYSNNLDLRQDVFFNGIILSLFGGLINYFIFYDLMFSTAIFCFLLILSIEKILIVDGNLILATIYKSIFSILLLGMVLLFDSPNIKFLYSLSIILGTFIWILVLFREYSHIFVFFNLKESVFKLLFLIKEGFFIASQSVVLIGFFLFDRFIFIENYSEHIGEYSISFSFSQIIFIALNTISFSMQKQLGENLNSYSNNSLKRLLLINIAFFISLLVISIIMVYIFIYYSFFSQYGNFLFSFIIISFSYGIYYLFSSYSVLAIYKGYSFYFLVLILIAFIVNAILSYACIYYNVSYYLVLIKSGFIFIILSFVKYSFIMKLLNSKNIILKENCDS